MVNHILPDFSKNDQIFELFLIELVRGFVCLFLFFHEAVKRSG